MPAVYTRTGDKGSTGLFGGARVPKQSLRVEAYGSVDEGNAALGAAKALLEPGQWRDRVHEVQQRLFVLGAELASDPSGLERLGNKVGPADVEVLERLIDDCLAIAGLPKSFVVPGRDPLSAAFHHARTVLRRAERRTLTLADHEPVRPEVIAYLNRLSDAVYALARLAETWHEVRHVEKVVREVVARHWPELSGQPVEPGEPDQGGGRWAAMRRHGVGLPGRMDLALARRLADAVEARASELGAAVTVAVVDEAAHPVLLHRMPDAILASIEYAGNKAWTAATFRQHTAALGPLAASDGAFQGLGHGYQGRVVLFGGGVPLYAGAGLIGALGVSGGTAEEDCDIATNAIKTVMGVEL